eukprot:SAG11_NODE_31364_length_292_cov_1.041451_1_plen_63_part_10
MLVLVAVLSCCMPCPQLAITLAESRGGMPSPCTFATPGGVGRVPRSAAASAASALASAHAPRA